MISLHSNYLCYLLPKKSKAIHFSTGASIISSKFVDYSEHILFLSKIYNKPALIYRFYAI